MTRRGFLGSAGLSGVVVAVGCEATGAGAAGTGELPVLAETEVLVVGGGPAGIAAAMGAARAGADTMLLERFGFYGGVITQAIMGSITWWRYAATVDAGGVVAEIEARAKAMGGSINLLEAVDDPGMRSVLLSLAEQNGLVVDGKPTYEILRSELFKAVADDLVLGAGVRPLLHCHAVDSIVEGGAIRGVVTESKSGRQVIRAQRVIDATGDADVAARAGAPFTKAPKDQLMEVTTNFSCGNVNLVDFMAFVATRNRTMADWVDEDCGKERDMFSTHVFQPFADAAAAGEIPAGVEIRAFPGAFTSTGGVLSLNAVHQYGVDCTDVWDLTNAEIEGRRRVLMAMDVLRKRVPGFENAELTLIGPSLGCRESRRIEGEYAITRQDVTGQARFDDSIGIFPEFLDAYRVLCLPTTGRYFQVPYRITVPLGVEDLLVAGRCVSGDRVSFGSVRQMGCCMVTGQGAGVAAAVSLRTGRTCRRVDVAEVQRELMAQGVRIA
jgi:hypothetical protein